MERYIVIIAGSKSDNDLVSPAVELLKKFDIPHKVYFLSSHRNLDKLIKTVREETEKGAGVFIAIAGLAAHLSGVIAACTNLPVIGVPKDAGTLGGIDALFSMVQMPKGVPVATMGIGKHGLYNSIIFALEILSLNGEEWQEKLKRVKDEFNK